MVQLWLNTGMNPQEHNPYDFIMNPAAPPPKKRLQVGGPNALMIKIGLIIGAVIAAMILVTVLINLFTGGKTSTDELRLLAQTQQELIRVASTGESDARNQNVKNFAKNAQLTITSQQVKALGYLASKDVDMKEKELNLKLNAATDKQLEQAEQTSTFDNVFLQVMQQSLESYSNELQTLYGSTSNTTVKKLLKDNFDQTQLLRQQQPSSVSTTETTDTTTLQ